MERGAQDVESLGTKVEARKDWIAVVGEMAQVGRAPEEVVAHPPEKQRWQKYNPGKEGARVASQWRLSHGKSGCGFPTSGHDDLRRSPSG